MDATYSVSIHAGGLAGQAAWYAAHQTFGAELRLFDQPIGDGQFPPAEVAYGHRWAEFVTTDVLASALAARGLALDPADQDNLDELSRVVATTHGVAEVVGLTDRAGERSLFLLTPARLLVSINPRLDHIDHRLTWGDTTATTVEAARLIGELVWARSPGPELEHFALSLTHELLRGLPDDFAVSAASICEWYLADAKLSSSLSPTDLASLRRRAGLGKAIRPRARTTTVW